MFGAGYATWKSHLTAEMVADGSRYSQSHGQADVRDCDTVKNHGNNDVVF